MENLILGFLTGGSLILAIGPQNLFVIEQGLKKNFIFTITTICAISDVLLIFIGVFVYHIFIYVSVEFEVFLNIVLVFIGLEMPMSIHPQERACGGLLCDYFHDLRLPF